MAFSFDGLSGLRAGGSYIVLNARALSFGTAHIDRKLSARSMCAALSFVSAPRGSCAIFCELEDPVCRAMCACVGNGYGRWHGLLPLLLPPGCVHFVSASNGDSLVSFAALSRPFGVVAAPPSRAHLSRAL